MRGTGKHAQQKPDRCSAARRVERSGFRFQGEARPLLRETLLGVECYALNRDSKRSKPESTARLPAAITKAKNSTT